MLRLRTDDLEFREIEGEVVALDLKTSSYLGINETGGTLWPLLQEGTDEEALVRKLVETFDVSESTAQRDVKAFVEALRERGLLLESP